LDELKGTGIIVRVSLNDHAFALAQIGFSATKKMFCMMVNGTEWVCVPAAPGAMVFGN
jgi:hypothetical protein